MLGLQKARVLLVARQAFATSRDEPDRRGKNLPAGLANRRNPARASGFFCRLSLKDKLPRLNFPANIESS